MVVFLRPTESSTIFIQQLGRGLRKYENKPYVTILDFIGNSYNRSVQVVFALGTQVRHTYPDIDINLILYNARIISGKPKLLEHNDLKWITSNEIDKYEFCPADTDVLELIKNKY